MARNKVIFGGETLIDLSNDTVTQSDVLDGITFHLPSGEVVEGTCEFDVDSSSATANVAEVLATKTFAKNGSMLTGTMPNNGAVTGSITTVDGEYTIPNGYHDGSGKVSISLIERAKIIAQNIKAGIEILGVEGTYSGEGVSAQSKTATPTTSQQTILPDSGYDYLSQVVVNAIPYTETPNSAGGTTVTIG